MSYTRYPFLIFILGLVIGLIWFRVLEQVSVLSSLGPLITIVKYMLGDLAKVIIVYSLVASLFACVGLVLFR